MCTNKPHHITGRLALDLHPDDVFWCTADPGWVTGTSYGIIAPLTCGVTSIVDEGDFDAERWYGILQDQRVTVWYTAPTAIRMMMKAGAPLAARHDAPALRFLASVGEPLNPEAVSWGLEAFGQPFHDNWWQTETGGIMLANFASMDIRPGSMGRPLPGIEAAIVRRLAEGRVEVIDAPEHEHHRLDSCSRWPEKAGCGQECQKQIETQPMDCLVRTQVSRWYADKTCAICGKALGEADWASHKPALRAQDGRTMEWSDVSPETMFQVMSTHAAICWDCHVAETFRRQRPDLVLDNPFAGQSGR